MGDRHKILSDLFPDLGESSYEDWDYQQSNVLLAFMNQRVHAAPEIPVTSGSWTGLWRLAPTTRPRPWPGCIWRMSVSSLRSGTSSIISPPQRPSISL